MHAALHVVPSAIARPLKRLRQLSGPAWPASNDLGQTSNLAFYPGGILVPQFLGGTQREIPARFHEASPVHYISANSPPTFIYHASSDRLVPPEHALAAIKELEKYDVSHDFYWIEGRDHIAAFLLPADAINKAIDFLDRHLGHP